MSDFSLNLVSLAGLEDQRLDWDHRSGKIRSGAQIIGSTSRNGNNYKIGQVSKTILGTAFSTFTPERRARNKIRNPKVSKPRDLKTVRRHRLATPASPDVWHQRMGHIGPLGLHQLGKECLGVSLQGKSMSQCPHCALSKITQQISRVLPANRSTRPFHRVYIDWMDLQEG